MRTETIISKDRPGLEGVTDLMSPMCPLEGDGRIIIRDGVTCSADCFLRN